MATISFTDGSGELKTVPTWATEAQMEKLLTALGANGDQKKVAEVSEKLVNEIKDTVYVFIGYVCIQLTE